jgi:nicotinamide mononucleotide adenylyltransferase
MCELAVEGVANWVMVDAWETVQDKLQPTTDVLDHFKNVLNMPIDGGNIISNSNKPIQVVLLAGMDLLQTMSNPDSWSPAELEHILGGYITFAVERTGTSTRDTLLFLQNWEKNIYFIPQLVFNNVSSSLIRRSLENRLSVRYLVPEQVIAYIESNELYRPVGEENPSTSLEGTSAAEFLARGH